MPKVPYKKRKDGRYYKQIVYGYDANGKRKVKTFYDNDWHELEKKIRNFQLELDNGTYTDSDITLGECIRLWWKTKEDLAPGTKYNYKLHLRMLTPLENVKLKDLKPSVFSNFLEDECETAKGSRAHEVYSLLKSVLTLAVKRGFISTNIMDRVERPKKKCSKRRSLTEGEKKAVEAVINSKELSLRSKTLVAILYYTGMRRNEVLDLKRSDINFKESYIYVKRTLATDAHGKIYEKDSPKTPAGIRKIPMIPQLVGILKEYLNSLKSDEEYLFTTRYGTFITNGNFAIIWRNIIAAINGHLDEEEQTNITAHYFRHNYATELIYAGVPLKTVQYIMGHENIKMTMDIYANTRLDAQDVISKLSSYMN